MDKTDRYHITPGAILDTNQSHAPIRWFKKYNKQKIFKNSMLPPVPCNYPELQLGVIL